MRAIVISRVTACLICLAAISCKQDNLVGPTNDLDFELTSVIEENLPNQGIAGLIQPESGAFDQIPQDPKNPLTREKVLLGQLLFHETGLAIHPKYPDNTYTYSCASCHHADAGFQAGIAQGIGEGGWGFGFSGEGRIPKPGIPLDSLDVQPLRSPTALNVAFQELMLWNGQFGATGLNVDTDAYWDENSPKETNHLGYQGVETQAIAGLKVHRMGLDNLCDNYLSYKNHFDEAFGNVDESKRYDREHAGLAIAAYERTLFPNQAPFQRWLKGESTAMSDEQKQGAILFFGKAKCYSCHNGPALNSMSFHALGMDDLVVPEVPEDVPENFGRGGFTQAEEDMYKFKTPQLYNLKDSPFFGHGGSFRSLKAVVEYKKRAVGENERVPVTKLDPEFTPLQLTQNEVNLLVGFLETALYDSDLHRYVPAETPTNYCFPNNDMQAKKDQDCE